MSKHCQIHFEIERHAAQSHKRRFYNLFMLHDTRVCGIVIPKIPSTHVQITNNIQIRIFNDSKCLEFDRLELEVYSAFGV